jgi:hypothetical protein
MGRWVSGEYPPKKSRAGSSAARGKVCEVDGGYFGGSRQRRAEIGHHHHVAGVYLLRYAQEASWREDHCRMANGEQVSRIARGWR